MILTCFDHFDLYFSDLFTCVDLSHVQMCQICVQMTSKSFPIPHVLPPPWGPGALGPCLSRISPPRWVQHLGSFHLRRTRCPRSLTRRRVVGRTPPPCHGKVSPVETTDSQLFMDRLFEALGPWGAFYGELSGMGLNANFDHGNGPILPETLRTWKESQNP